MQRGLGGFHQGATASRRTGFLPKFSMNPSPTSESLEESIQTLGLKQIQRHLFLCADQTKPKCCPKSVSLEAWDYLKRRLNELGLDQPTPELPDCIFRTKANCLRVCTAG